MISHADRVGILIFAKIPGLGIAKSRIAKTEGPEKADHIYRELLEHTSKIVANYDYHVAFSGDESHDPLESYFPHASSFIKQVEGSLGEKLNHAFQHLFSISYDVVFAIGCDSPTLTIQDFESAITKCKSQNDVILGPTEDGGYYLAGGTKKCLPIFSANQWSTPKLLDETLTIANKNKLSFHLLPVRYDIDLIDDYKRWKQEK